LFEKVETMPEAFEPFPEIAALGRVRLQQLCDEWCRQPQAKEFGIVFVRVTAAGSGLEPVFEVHASNYARGDELHFPFDRVLEFIIEHGCHEADRSNLKDRLRQLRQKVGVAVFQRYKVNLDAYTMALRCPSCSMVLMSQYRIFKGQEFGGTFEPMTCPGCQHKFPIIDRDFFPVLMPAMNAVNSMDNEEKLLHETAAFLNSVGVFAQVVPAQRVGSANAQNKGYIAVWQTIPGANVFVHGMNYFVVGGNASHECPIDDRQGLADILLRIRRGEG
jgi:hypothetical protein